MLLTLQNMQWNVFYHCATIDPIAVRVCTPVTHHIIMGLCIPSPPTPRGRLLRPSAMPAVWFAGGIRPPPRLAARGSRCACPSSYNTVFESWKLGMIPKQDTKHFLWLTALNFFNKCVISYFPCLWNLDIIPKLIFRICCVLNKCLVFCFHYHPSHHKTTLFRLGCSSSSVFAVICGQFIPCTQFLFMHNTPNRKFEPVLNFFTLPQNAVSTPANDGVIR